MSGVPLNIATIAPGSDYGTYGEVTPHGSGQAYSWFATISGTSTPAGALTVYNGPLAKEIAAVGGNAGFSDAALTGLGLPWDGAGVAISGPTMGATGGASSFVAIQFFNETLPAGVDFVLWQSGAGEAGQTAAFSFAGAGAGSVPVAASDWTYQADPPSAVAGVATVTGVAGLINVTSSSIFGTNPDAVVVFSSDVPLTSLTVRANAAASDTWGVALVGAVAQNAAPCFLTGTEMMTPSGPVPVERLRPGDLVVSRFGGPVPVVWIGRRRLIPARHARPGAVLPFRIRRDAVAAGVPARDLLLSPDHAVCLGGVLIPVKYLANGRTIFQDHSLAAVEYWHVELARHDILLAEALPVESYLDTGNRAAFDGGAGAVALHPDFARRTWEADSCLPLWGEGGPAESVRACLAARATLLAGAAGYSATFTSDQLRSGS